MFARHYITAETTILLFLHHNQGDLWPKVKAPNYFAAALRNQLWTVAPNNGGTTFPIDGDVLREGLPCPGKEIIGEFGGNSYEDAWGYASPIMAQDQEGVDKLKEKFENNNGSCRFIDPVFGGKNDLPPIIHGAFRATAATKGVPRTTIHLLTPEEIASRGPRASADAAQMARRDFWTQGGIKSKEDIKKYGDKVNDAFGLNDTTKEEAKERFLKDFESDLDVEPLCALIWENRDVFGDDILQIKEGIITYEVELGYTLENVEPKG
jgi:hypothetical protein